VAPDSRDTQPTVLVDARNVRRSTWPNIPEAELVERCLAWAEDEGCRAVVVFDGEAPGGVIGERMLDVGSLLVGTGAESADDWIARSAADLAASGRSYWLVTSDRELRARAGGAAERIVGGGTFARSLLAV
jgi:predicted RNA-binding protein with PIN domain